MRIYEKLLKKICVKLIQSVMMYFKFDITKQISYRYPLRDMTTYFHGCQI